MSEVDDRERGNQHSSFTLAVFVTIFSAVIAPIIEAIIIGYQFSADKQISALWVLLLIFVPAHLWAVFISIQSARSSSHYVDYKILERQHRELSKEHKATLHNFRQVLAGNMANYLSIVGLDDLVGLLAQGKIETEKEALGRIVFPLVRFRAEVFGLSSRSKFNISIYKYSEEVDRLLIVYRHCDDRIPRRDRPWKPGLGHVGQAFLEKKIKISNDAVKSEELDLGADATDPQNYRSFISVPIIAPQDQASSDVYPYGVIVITSSEPYEFNKDLHEETLLALSKAIAIYFELEKGFSGDNDERQED